MYALTILLTILFDIIICRDFYVGMLKPNDILVAQDMLYKEKIYYSSVSAKYGRIFKCPITYFRVVDRLGVGRGPKIEIIRGGLLKKYLVLRFTSVYNYPISVNIYIGCEHKVETVKTTIKEIEKSTDTKVQDVTTSGGTSEATTVSISNTTINDKLVSNDTVTNTTVVSNGTSTNTTQN